MATCHECGRVFDLTADDPTDANEWYYGHDCEEIDMVTQAELVTAERAAQGIYHIGNLPHDKEHAVDTKLHELYIGRHDLANVLPHARDFVWAEARAQYENAVDQGYTPHIEDFFENAIDLIPTHLDDWIAKQEANV